MIYKKLYLVFFKIGLFAVGGGLATLPFLKEIADKYGWITLQEIVDMLAISESTPGPIGINMATYTGFKTAKVLGGVIATLGLITPSIIVIILIAYYYNKFSDEPIVQAGFYGIRPAVAGLIGAAGFEVMKISLFNLSKFAKTSKVLDLFNIKEILIFLLVFYLLNKYEKHPILYLVGAAIIGIIFRF